MPAASLVPVFGQGQFAQQGPKLTPTEAAAVTNAGNSVSISGDGNIAIVGGSLSAGRAAAAWIYTRTSGTWTQAGAALSGSAQVGTAGLVATVAMSADGNTAVIGSSGDNGSNGAIWLFTRSGGFWAQQGAKLTPEGGVGVLGVGQSVAISADGNTAVVGGPGDTSGAGAVWVFTRTAGVWTQQGLKLTGSGAVGAAQLGKSVAVSADGNTLIGGGQNDNNSAGAAWIFTRSNGVWTQQGSKLAGTGAVGAAYQGSAVAISGDGNTVLSGGYFDNTAVGAAWVFTRSGSSWTQQGSKLVGTGAAGLAYQGYSVALSADGNTALSGGEADNNSTGAVWAFTRSAGVWTQLGSKFAGTGAVGNAVQGFSTAISADSNTAITGGFSDNNSTGAAWIFSQPVLYVAASHRGSFTQGQNNANYAVIAGNYTLSAITGTVTVKENLPSGLTLVSMAGSGWACSTSTATCTRNNTLSAGASYPPIAVTVNVAANASSTLVNSVTATWPNSVVSTGSDSTAVQPPFNDVVSSDFFNDGVNLMRQYGITGGCQASPPLYCPNDNVTRAQMAIFMVRAVMGGDSFTYSSTPYFNDVPSTAFGFPWIQKMFELGITAGCGAGNYCPNDAVTRGQMGVFVIRARLGAPADSTFTFPSAAFFTDVASSNSFYKWIQRMRLDQITAGCGGTNYCPNDPVTRGQMAIFIMRGTFNQLLPAATPVLTAVNPVSAALGQTVTVTLTGANTNFAQGTSAVSAGAGVTVGAVTVTSATSLTVQLTVAAGASTGPRTLLVTSGSEEAVLPNGLSVR